MSGVASLSTNPFNFTESRKLMDEKTLRILLGPELALAQAIGHEAMRERRKMCTGKICSSCKSPLPQPQTSEAKRCASCANKHHVRMLFHRSFSFGWHCNFSTERWRPLPKRVIFSDAARIWEAARRGNGLIDDASREALELAIETGRGGIMLRLTDEQYQALGGVL